MFVVTALEEGVMMALDESVASCLLHTVRKHSENEEFLSMLCTLLMMVSASGGSSCSFFEEYEFIFTF